MEQGKLMAAANSWKTVPQTMSSNVHDRLKFGKLFRKDLTVYKNVKRWISRILSQWLLMLWKGLNNSLW